MMGQLEVPRSFLSHNSKTGVSVNTHSCSPTPICSLFCYRHKRTKEQAKEIERQYGFNPGSNSGPITWPTQVAAYKRNEALIKQAAADGTLDVLAARLAQQMSYREEHLRWCGTGDLFPELCELIVLTALKGVRSFGFSRKPIEMFRLCEMLNQVGIRIGDPRRPYFTASTDASVDSSYGGGLMLASKGVNGKPAMAYATWRTGEEAAAEIHALPWYRHLRVVFGLHSTGLKHTVVGHPLECQATAGEKIKCVECRRCYGE
jgi:hypothetical protein